ncbi:unknown [Feldmannia species virus]|uniref:Uncharacterized protein n=1 Tax=Feldmannia species virus TaxID=39420 RepID=B5LWF9_9PHYC|nr:hypothetical protein FeldSpV_gp070 [Feldmannia species virus]ACH46822.1 unknown [Feldmannia species virus]
MDVFMRNVENSSIRVDKASKKGSVIDTVRMVLGCTSSAGNTYLRNLTSRFPDICVQITRRRINGKGRATPVADTTLLVQIVLLLPGQKAIEFRRKSAEKVCRLLGGGTSLVVEMDQRCAGYLQRSPGGVDANVIASSSSAKEVAQQASKRQRC